jgi:hypothetical protein
MPEGLEDWARLLLPMAVASLDIELARGRFLADGHEPWVQLGSFGREFLEQLLDPLDRSLEAVDLEALVVVAVNRILLPGLKPPEQRIYFLQVLFDGTEQLSFRGVAC